MMLEQRNVNSKKYLRTFLGNNQMNQMQALVVVTMLLSVELVFLNRGLQIITGPILAAGFFYLYFNGYRAFVTAIIIMANDALGCILLGKIDFSYLLSGMLFLSFLLGDRTIRFRRSSGIAFILMIVTLLLCVRDNFVSIKGAAVTILYVLSLCNCTDDENSGFLYKGVGIVVFLISIHACITGGVNFYEPEIGTNIVVLRKGILGIGIGDPNYSSLVLNIGIACVMFDKDFKWYIKCVMVVIMISALTVTQSISGILGMLLVFAMYLVVRRESVPKKVRNLLLGFLFVLMVIFIYLSLPMQYRSDTIEAYIERLSEKIYYLTIGNQSKFTTGRSRILEQNLNYIFNDQPVFGLLFGLNPLTGDYARGYVPHNTYIDILLQLGMIGFVIVFTFIIVRGIRDFRNHEVSRLTIALKLLFLFYFMNLSIYDGSMFALAYLCLIIL